MAWSDHKVQGYEVSVLKKMIDIIGGVGGVSRLSRPPFPEVTLDEETLIESWLPKWKAWL